VNVERVSPYPSPDHWLYGRTRRVDGAQPSGAGAPTSCAMCPRADLQLVRDWAITGSPSGYAYPMAEKFKPERFLNKDGSIRDDPIEHPHLGLGLARGNLSWTSLCIFGLTLSLHSASGIALALIERACCKNLLPHLSPESVSFYLKSISF
jgi:hypothetical protein